MRVTPLPAPAFRYVLLVSVVTALMLAMAGSNLVAPGPPPIVIEPQTGMELVAIEPGTFTMGSPAGEPGRQIDEEAHTVTLTKRIFMGRYEVTQAQWATVMDDNPSHFTGCGRCPVEGPDFFEVDQFITNLNAQSTSMRYRLPTEAEWEYACRAGTTTPYSTGGTLDETQANIDAHFEGPGIPGGPSFPLREKPAPVGSYPPNAWGLFDMHGNVWEWTNDWYGPYRTDPAFRPSGQAVNPTGSSAGTKRVIRGGSWHFDANSARCGLRYTHAPQDSGPSLGFRVVAEPITRRRSQQ